MNAKKTYETPDIAKLGTVVESTGHCTSGCNHDSELHPDEFKSATSELSGGKKGDNNDAVGC